MPAWTQVAFISWRPELRFFERRHEVLRALDDQGMLRAFQWASDSLSARLGPFELFEVRPSGAAITLGSPRVSHQASRDALEIALEMLKPRQVVFSRALVQTVLPIASDAGVTAVKTAQSLLPALSGDVDAQDWAMIFDGSSTVLGLFQVEFGVIRADELIDRVTRQAGRVQPWQPMQDVVDRTGIPDAAMFFAWTWRTPHQVEEDNPVESICGLWSALVDESERLGIIAMNQLELKIRTLDDARKEEAQ